MRAETDQKADESYLPRVSWLSSSSFHCKCGSQSLGVPPPPTSTTSTIWLVIFTILLNLFLHLQLKLPNQAERLNFLCVQCILKSVKAARSPEKTESLRAFLKNNNVYVFKEVDLEIQCLALIFRCISSRPSSATGCTNRSSQNWQCWRGPSIWTACKASKIQFHLRILLHFVHIDECGLSSGEEKKSIREGK